jgi:hypothetical protein
MGAGLQELYPQQNKDTLDTYSEQLFDFQIFPESLRTKRDIDFPYQSST